MGGNLGTVHAPQSQPQNQGRQLLLMKRPNICENFVSREGDVGSNVYVSNIECPGETALVLRNHPSHRSLPFIFAWREKYYGIWATIHTTQDTTHQFEFCIFMHNTWYLIIAQKKKQYGDSDKKRESNQSCLDKIFLTRTAKYIIGGGERNSANV